MLAQHERDALQQFNTTNARVKDAYEHHLKKRKREVQQLNADLARVTGMITYFAFRVLCDQI